MPGIIQKAETQFFANDGTPLAGGKVYTYIVGTTTPKTTWQDPAGTVENANPVTLDSAGRCIMFGVGAYRQQVFDAIGDLIWDQTTAPPSLWDLNGVGFLVDTGTVNALAVTLPVAPAALADLAGVALYIQVGNTNTGAVTLNVSGLGAIAVEQGGAALGTGVLVAGALYPFIYTGSVFQIPGSAASSVSLAQLQNGSIAPKFGVTQTLRQTITGNGSADLTIVDTTANGATIVLVGNGGLGKTLRVQDGNFAIINNAGTAVIFSIDDAGNVVAAGNITGTPA